MNVQQHDKPAHFSSTRTPDKGSFIKKKFASTVGSESSTKGDQKRKRQESLSEDDDSDGPKRKKWSADLNGSGEKRFHAKVVACANKICKTMGVKGKIEASHVSVLTAEDDTKKARIQCLLCPSVITVSGTKYDATSCSSYRRHLKLKHNKSEQISPTDSQQSHQSHKIETNEENELDSSIIGSNASIDDPLQSPKKIKVLISSNEDSDDDDNDAPKERKTTARSYEYREEVIEAKVIASANSLLKTLDVEGTIDESRVFIKRGKGDARKVKLTCLLCPTVISLTLSKYDAVSLASYRRHIKSRHTKIVQKSATGSDQEDSN